MNSFAFLMMLGMFALLAYWYVRNAEAGRDGGLGPLALTEEDAAADGSEEGEAMPRVTGAAAIRARIQGQDPTRPVGPATDKVRAAAAAARAKAYRPKDDR